MKVVLVLMSLRCGSGLFESASQLSKSFEIQSHPNGSQTDGTPFIFAVMPHLDILAALSGAGANPNLLYHNNVPTHTG